MELYATDLAVGYGGDKIIFSNITVHARQGEMIVLLGVNGIGKSTLLRTISGLQKSVHGKVLVGNRNIGQLSSKEKAKLISIVLTERISIENMSVHDFVLLGRSPYTNWLGSRNEEDETEVERVISLLKMEKLRGKFFNHLSDGERQKALIARAICQQTPVIILDEPTAFLDFRNKREILALLASVSIQMNKIVILSTHDIEAALEFCTACWLMEESGTFTEIKKGENFTAEVKRRMFGKVSGH